MWIEPRETTVKPKYCFTCGCPFTKILKVKSDLTFKCPRCGTVIQDTTINRCRYCQAMCADAVTKEIHERYCEEAGVRATR